MKINVVKHQDLPTPPPATYTVTLTLSQEQMSLLAELTGSVVGGGGGGGRDFFNDLFHELSRFGEMPWNRIRTPAILAE